MFLLISFLLDIYGKDNQSNDTLALRELNKVEKSFLVSRLRRTNLGKV